MPSSTTKILVGAAAALAVATVLYLPDGQAEPSTDDAPERIPASR